MAHGCATDDKDTKLSNFRSRLASQQTDERHAECTKPENGLGTAKGDSYSARPEQSKRRGRSRSLAFSQRRERNQNSMFRIMPDRPIFVKHILDTQSVS